MPETPDNFYFESRAAEPREIAPGIWWMPLCLEFVPAEELTHIHNAQYLIVGSDKTLLFDTGMPFQWNEIDSQLDQILGDRPLDYFVPSHPEIGHCSGTGHMFEKYPDTVLIGDVRDYTLFWPEYADRMIAAPIGSTIDLGSHTWHFVDALLKDLPSTQWGYESSQQVLFPADGFAYSHQPPVEGDDRPTHSPGQCRLMATELPGEPGPEQVVWITRSALYWTRFVKMDRFYDQLQTLLSEHPVQIVAPAHGVPINDMKILWTIWEALGLSYSPDAAGVKAAGAAIGGRS